MKQFENIFRTLCLFALGWLTSIGTRAQQASPDTLCMDSIQIGLLTCSPHPEVYSLYGHTALRVQQIGTKHDVVYNFGIFNSQEPYFPVRFMAGLTDYLLGKDQTRRFLSYYLRWNCVVTEQVLNLSNDEKARLMAALEENYLPQNRTYRYNIFYDNCATRPRDIIERCVDGQVVYAAPQTAPTTFRQLVHSKTQDHPWAAMGNDLFLGQEADRPISMREEEFLPENLMRDFWSCTIEQGDSLRPLVLGYRQWGSPQEATSADGGLTPTHCAIVLLVVSLILLTSELRRRRSYVWWDVTLLLLQGLPGLLLLPMLFSQHPTTGSNLQVLLLNPLPLFFIPSVLHRRHTRWFRINAVLIIAFFVGAWWQQYAEGLIIVASCLLLRYLKHYNDK